MKTCSCCKIQKEDFEFGKSSRFKDNLRGQCKECEKNYRKKVREKTKDYHKKYDIDNKERIKGRKKNYYLLNKKKINNRNSDWYFKNKEELNKHRKSKYNKNTARNYALKINFGITLEDYNKIFEDQNGKCKICGKHQSELTLSLNVDHCHITGKIRGLLCGNCNKALGLFKDNTKSLKNAINYLIHLE